MVNRQVRFFFLTLSCLASFCSVSCADAVKITRGPYLQSVTSESIVVRWRQDEDGQGRVGVVEQIGQEARIYESPHFGKDHEVFISNLKPDTQYYYAIVSPESGQMNFTTEYLFKTAPERGRPASIRFWVLGDPGTADDHQIRVKDAYDQHLERNETDLILLLGDNAYANETYGYESGSDEAFQKAIFDMYGDFLKHAPLWSAFGNHEGKNADSNKQSGVYYDIFTFPESGQAGGVPSGTEAYYAFDYGNIHFISLNSDDIDRSENGAMAKWLEEDLLHASDQQWIIAFWHHAPYSHGTYDTDVEDPKAGRRGIEMRENIVPILERGGVDLVLTGHSHVYERSFLINGHYGTSDTLESGMVLDSTHDLYQKPSGVHPNQGTVYLVLGSSGKTEPAPLNHPIMAVSLSVLGSVVLEVDSQRLQAGFLDDQGNIRDSFTLLKGSPPSSEP